MRRAFNSYGLIMVDDVFIGVNLGFDFTAEHEWGIDGVKNIFGIPKPNKDNIGVKSRSITKIDGHVIFKKKTFKNNKFAVLYTSKSWENADEAKKNTPHEIKKYYEDIMWDIKHEEKKPKKDGEVKDHIVSAWDESSFGIGVMGDVNIGYLKELYNAILNKNIVIATINAEPKNPFNRGGLSLLIADKTPSEYINDMYDVDKKSYDLIDYEKKIGMTKIIEKYGKKNGYNGHGYYTACSPKWINYEDEKGRNSQKEKLKTKYDIQYWINYSDDDHNYGWFNVEIIKKWLTGNKKLTELMKEEK